MGRAASGEPSAWSRALMRAITQLREEAGITNQELLKRSGLSSSYFYTRLREEAPLNTNDLERLALALDKHPHEVSRVAASLSDERVEPTVLIDRRELARRLQLLSTSPILSGMSFASDDLFESLDLLGIGVDPSDWAALLTGDGSEPVNARLLEGIAVYAGVPEAFLLDLEDLETLDVVAAQLDFRSAVRDTGATSISARAVGEMSPAALREVTRSIRSLDIESD